MKHRDGDRGIRHCRKIDYGQGKKHFRNVVNSILQSADAVDEWERIYQTAICKEQAKRRKVDHGRYRPNQFALSRTAVLRAR